MFNNFDNRTSYLIKYVYELNYSDKYDFFVPVKYIIPFYPSSFENMEDYLKETKYFTIFDIAMDYFSEFEEIPRLDDYRKCVSEINRRQGLSSIQVSYYYAVKNQPEYEEYSHEEMIDIIKDSEFLNQQFSGETSKNLNFYDFPKIFHQSTIIPKKLYLDVFEEYKEFINIEKVFDEKDISSKYLNSLETFTDSRNRIKYSLKEFNKLQKLFETYLELLKIDQISDILKYREELKEFQKMRGFGDKVQKEFTYLSIEEFLELEKKYQLYIDLETFLEEQDVLEKSNFTTRSADITIMTSKTIFKNCPIGFYEKYINLDQNYTQFKVDSYNLLELFDSFNATYDVPYIELMYNQQSFIKLYQSGIFDEKLNYEFIKKIKPLKDNNIRILFWSEESSNTRNYEKYSEAILNKNSLSFNVQNMEMKNLIFERISNALNMVIGKYKIENIVGTFSIYNLKMDDQTLSYALDSVLGNYLHINEYTKGAWDRKRIYLNYKTPYDNVYVKNPEKKSSYTIKKYSMSMSYGQRYTTGNNLYQVSKDGKQENKKFPHKTPYVIFKISRIYDDVIINTFISTFTRLMYYYNNVLKKDIIEYLSYMFPINHKLRVETFINTILKNMKNTNVTKNDIKSYLFKKIRYREVNIKEQEGVYYLVNDDLSITYLKFAEDSLQVGKIDKTAKNIFESLSNEIKSIDIKILKDGTYYEIENEQDKLIVENSKMFLQSLDNEVNEVSSFEDIPDKTYYTMDKYDKYIFLTFERNKAKKRTITVDKSILSANVDYVENDPPYGYYNKIENNKSTYTYLYFDSYGVYSGEIQINPYEMFIVLYDLMKNVYGVKKYTRLEKILRNKMCVDYEFFKFLDDQEKYINQLDKVGKNGYMNLKLNRRNDIKLYLPDLFIRQYPRVCVCAHQPIQVNEQDVEEWEKRTIGDKKRQVMKFDTNEMSTEPSEESKVLYFVCPDDSIPYPGLKKNNLSNSKKYPFIPCCYKEKQRNISIQKDKSKNVKKSIIKTNKLLSEERIGYLPEKLVDFMSEYTDDEIYRFGVPKDTNSFIHCVLRSMKHEQYMQSENKRDFVVDFRISLLNEINVSIVSQEMYDVSLEKVENVIKNSKFFFDPSYFYRILEVMFNINIFVFEQRIDSGTHTIIDIQIPRYEYKYFREIDLEKPCLILYQHRGSELNKSEIPQCEIIVSGNYSFTNDNSELIFLHDNNELTKTISKLFKTSLSIPPNVEDTLSNKILKNMNTQNILNIEVLSQSLDPYGKLQSINVKSEEKIITLLVPPSYPKNLKIDDNKIRADANHVISMFDEKLPDYIYSEYIEDENTIIGFWYDDVYVLINPETISEKLQKDLISKEIKVATDTLLWSDNIKRRYLLRKKNRILMSILLLMFIKYHKEKNIQEFNEKIVEDFFNDYVTLGKESESEYHINNVEILYSIKNYNLEKIIRLLEDNTENIIENNKFKCYSNVYFEQMKYFISYYYKTLEPKKENVNFLNELFLTENDFRKSPDFIIFDSREKLNNWYMTQKQTFNVNKKISQSNKMSENPFFLSFNYDIFIIQNVEGGIKNALYVATYWNKNKVNLGYEINEEQENIENIEYNLYNIGQDNVPIPIIVNKNVNINILKYRNIEKYAVMIPT